MPEQRLAQTAQQLTEALDRLVDQLAAVRRRTVYGSVGLLVGFIGIIVGVIGYVDARDAQDTANDIVAARDEARVAACQQDTRRVEGLYGAFHLSILTLVPPGQPLSPEQEALLARYDEAVLQALPLRDCSPQGIDVYYSTPPTTALDGPTSPTDPPATLAATTAPTTPTAGQSVTTG